MDYRTTVYCPNFENIGIKKSELLKEIRINHPRLKDIHTLVSSNKDIYKNKFMKVYNCKCAYCGVSIDIIPRSSFEVDHFIYKESKCFKSKKDAGYIENLILACHDCNHDKGSFEIPREYFSKLYPDEADIKQTFLRDGNYYIKVSKENNNDIIKEFYEMLHLGSEVHRIDYLLMNMIGLQNEISNKPEACSILGIAIQKLHSKRNLMHVNTQITSVNDDN